MSDSRWGKLVLPILVRYWIETALSRISVESVLQLEDSCCPLLVLGLKAICSTLQMCGIL